MDIKFPCPQAIAIKERIGYPDEIVTDDAKLNSEYQEVSVPRGRGQNGCSERRGAPAVLAPVTPVCPAARARDECDLPAWGVTRDVTRDVT